ncbi:ferric-dicitrate binding protein FerR (iron transport regulator) [Aquimarina sp. EL_43]|uniref:FecR family protein n=1 Tax=unclassified Aquimarina TaxID=2627091 RepID=UPI0018CAE6BF|nr:MULTISPECIES: FecR family protein [unclassified Aquimarina]MBG6132401.1 ferric-dicitrate binding protein FerR (iron transport regulator) [Aquimarina sp. EL_35]MBG6152532.1 ferric-dicitrate binding protein FerR (iron transport regulator) [Aquimarina sp. EL_32]MBG6170541.1 ferric-dicitrate binding protein FerR (iron transport regulator) [Aquimarina sp. EL_43]
MDKEYLIKKWLSDELSEEERRAFENLEDYDSHIKILEGAKKFKASEVVEITDLETFYARIHDKNQSKVKNIGWYKPLLKIAATVVIVLGVTSLFFMFGDTHVDTLIGEKITIKLPDASEVTLNSKSSVRYNEKKWDKIRSVNLDGEALFKVSKGSRFDVVTSFGVVTVLGTQFNVKSRDGYFEVTCLEGLVSLTRDENFTRNIPAGSSFRIVKDNITFEKNSNSFPSWVSNTSSFKSVPFEEVIKEFERHYDVTFSIDNIDTQRIFTGGFVHNNLQDGLKSITLPLDLNYSIDTSNHITFQKIKK